MEILDAKMIDTKDTQAANEPTTMKATEILTERGILIVPDVLASSGSVIVSYFEWAKQSRLLLARRRSERKTETNHDQIII